MRQFNYVKLRESSWDSELLSLVAQIREYKGKQESYLGQKQVSLERLVELAKIQSTDSSNRIEGIGTSPVRLKQLVEEKTTPRNRDEQEIIGYRDILNTIHESYEHIPLKKEAILQLHRDLLAYSDKTFGGKFKSTQNYIEEIAQDGRRSISFTPLTPLETPMAIETICTGYQEACDQQAIDPLILIPIFIGDFLCIHPFNDANGRISRLLTTLLLYKSGFMVGRYISIEKKIEETKGVYYDVLKKISQNWHEGQNDYTPFTKYLLEIVLSCYRDLENRLVKRSAYETVRMAVSETLGIFTKREILEQCPSVGSSSVEAALKKLTEEEYILRHGAGRSTTYVRSYGSH
ncbi:MAG: Fic family protein [Sphaerochaetaceae bacterium]